VPEVAESVEVAASPARVWEAVTDWEGQTRWALLTRVRGTVQGGRGVGGGVEAFTGIGPVGVLDTMTIVVWEPPVRCVVRHTGRVVRGSAGFEVTDLGGGRARLTWSEWLDLPFGRLGRVAWPLIRPGFRAGLRISLARFRRIVERAG
jgi:carbon monoxide dehydrogenase subunit G